MQRIFMFASQQTRGFAQRSQLSNNNPIQKTRADHTVCPRLFFERRTMQLLHHTKSGFEKKYSSKFRGVDWFKSKNAWRASINENGRKKVLGYFDSETEAARCYNEASKRLGRDILNILPQ